MLSAFKKRLASNIRSLYARVNAQQRGDFARISSPLRVKRDSPYSDSCSGVRVRVLIVVFHRVFLGANPSTTIIRHYHHECRYQNTCA